MRMANMTKLVSEAYREAVKTPGLLSALVESASSEVVSLHTRWSVANVARKAALTYNKQVLLNKEFRQIHETCGAPETGVEMMTIKDDTVIRIISGAKPEDTQIIEVWQREQGLVASFNMKEAGVHERIYTDTEFGSLQLSEDKRSLFYIAEKKKDKNVPFLSQAPSPEDEKSSLGCEFKFIQDWGEQMVGKVRPVIVKLDLTSEDPVCCDLVQGADDNFSPGLVRPWCRGLVGVGFRTTPRRLGKVYCSNRPSVLFHIPEGSDKWEVLRGDTEGEELGITQVHVSPSGVLVWLERTLSSDIYPGPHDAAMRLMTMTCDRTNVKVVVSEKHFEFPIYHPSICRRPWVNASTLAISGPQGQTMRPVFIDLNTGEVSVPGDESCLGVEILDVDSDIILGKKSDPLTPDHLVIANLKDVQSFQDLKFKPVSPSPCPVPGLTWKSLALRPDQGFTAHYVGPESGQDVPLVVFPHGGPHGVYMTIFKTFSMFLCKLGYGILYVNYRGSTGSGEDNVRSLLGRIGDQDVQDCHEATLAPLDNLHQLARDKVVLMGGSHGGFLVTHLAGQFPDLYKAAVAINPVTNLASLVGVSDIPDWSFNEAGLKYNYLHPTPEQLATMWDKSPIKHIENIKAPILLLIGKNDLRVNPTQGYEFYHSLKALGKTVEMNVYEDNHPIGKFEHDLDWKINSALFLNKHLGLGITHQFV